VLQLLSLMLYASSSSNSAGVTGSDLLDAITVQPSPDEVDSEETDTVELLEGIDNDNVREAFRVCCSLSTVQHSITVVKLSAN